MPLVPMQHQVYVSGGVKKRLEELIPPEARDWCHPAPVVSFEFPAEGILHLAKAQSADLIVMGVHKRAPRASAHLPGRSPTRSLPCCVSGVDGTRLSWQ